MSEFHIEQLVQKRATLKDMLLPAVFVSITVTSAFLTLTFLPSMMIVTIIFALITSHFVNGTKLEYEYVCTNGDLDIDKVINKSKRKHIRSISLDDMLLLAPLNSAELNQYKSLKVFDYSSRVNGKAVYKLVFKGKDSNIAMLFEPKEEIVNSVRMKAPRKVII